MRSDGMHIIGLTGGIGSGKSTVANLFAQHGVPVVDTDEIAHSLSRPPSEALERVARQFGPEYLTAEGSLDRQRMREHIFSSPEEKTRLEAIFHPLIKEEALRQLNQLPAHTAYALLVVPLLFETGGYADIIDRSLVVDCSEQHQIERAKQRSGLKKTTIEAIIASQCPRKTRIQCADDIILNESSLAHLQSAVSSLHQQYQD